MRFLLQFFFLFLLLLSSDATAQEVKDLAESPIKLEFVRPDYVKPGSTEGSFVVKNNYSTLDLKEYSLYWDLSYEGIMVTSGNFSLKDVGPNETEYIGIRKLFDLHLLEELGDGLISMYAEIQHVPDGFEPIPIIGESVVLAEAEKRILATPEQYHVIKVGGARIHRIANGNSVTLDIFNQIVALDLGEGNMLAGPLRPLISFSSLSEKQQVQHLIDSLGPSRVEIEEDKLAGSIAYDIDTFGLLTLRFSLSETGLLIGLELQGGSTSPATLGIEIPTRMLGDTSKYLGSRTDPHSNQFGDSRLGLHDIPDDLYLLRPEHQTLAFVETRSIFTERGDIHGVPFVFQLHPIVEGNQGYVGLSSHPMEPGTHIIQLSRAINSRFGARKAKPLSSGDWLIAPRGTKD